jgi:CheY-like chemotaxis protein
MQKLCYKILLVEDDADDRYIMRQAFHELDFSDEVKIFASGEDLLTYLERLSSSAFPDLIVLDYNMPALNGGELSLYLKKHPPYHNISIAVYSTGISPKMQDQLMAAGVLKCYSKGLEYGDVQTLAKEFKSIVAEVPRLSVL